MLEHLQSANSLRLTRFQQLLELPGWQALYVPSLQMPQPEYWIASLQLNLVLLDLQRALTQPMANDVSALQALATWVDFWRAVQAQPQDAVSLLLAGRYIEDALRITSTWLDHRTQAHSDADQAALDRILRAPAAALDWTEAVRFEYQLFDAGMRSAVGTMFSTLGKCVQGNSAGGCWTQLATHAAYAHQATMNLHAIHRTQMQRLLQADPTQLQSVGSESSAVIEATLPNLHDRWVALDQMSYNYAGRVLAAVAIPAFDWHLRGHDQEALRRMLVVKRMALDAGLTSAGMPAFLAQQPTQLRNPYDALAFAWDPLFQELYFQPRAVKHWQRERLGLTVRLKPTAAISLCHSPILLRLTVVELGTQVDQQRAWDTVRRSSCGSGLEPRWHGIAADPSNPSDPLFTQWQRHRALTVMRNGEQIGVRATIEHQGQLLDFETTFESKTDTQDVVLSPLGSQASIRLILELSTAMFADKDTSFADLGTPISVNVDAMEPADIARSVAAVSTIRLRDTEKLARTRISLRGDFSVQSLLAELAATSKLRLVRQADGVFRFQSL
jgi:hypothetical protein